MTGTGLGRWFLYLLIAGNAVAFVVGVLLWARPQRYLRWFEPTRGSPRSVRQVVKPLDVMRDADRLLLDRPRLIGAVIVASSLYILAKGTLFVSGLSLREGGQVLRRLFGGAQSWSPQGSTCGKTWCWCSAWGRCSRWSSACWRSAVSSCCDAGRRPRIAGSPGVAPPKTWPNLIIMVRTGWSAVGPGCGAQ